MAAPPQSTAPLFFLGKQFGKRAIMWTSLILPLVLVITIHSPLSAFAQQVLDIGVCYGMLGNDLPLPAEVVALYKQNGISKMRLYDPNHDALEALKDQNIQLVLGVRNVDIQNLASGLDFAGSWFATNMEPYINNIPFFMVIVGNEVIPGDIANHIAPAMQNLLTVLQSHNLTSIKVTTAVALTVLQNSYPPSASEFTPDALGPLVAILKVIAQQPAIPILMVNVYPYFAYAGDPAHVSLDYAQFTAPGPVVHDGALEYQNLFDAMVDGVYWAMEKAGFPNIGVAVSETGWPSSGNGDFTTPELASVYNKNLLQHIVKHVGTPKRPGTYMHAFIFAMFNENQKPIGIEQHWGLFYPNKQPVYSMFSTMLK